MSGRSVAAPLERGVYEIDGELVLTKSGLWSSC
jgi:hypothetical protein